MSIDEKIRRAEVRRQKFMKLAAIERGISRLSKKMVVVDGPTRKAADVILHAVAREYGLRPGLIMTKCREPWIAVPRMLCTALLRDFWPGTTWKQTANAFGALDHSSAFHARARVQDLIDTEPVFKARVDRIKEELMNIFKDVR
jgi:chromosomal replication initiation ATPase DnaA